MWRTREPGEVRRGVGELPVSCTRGQRRFWGPSEQEGFLGRRDCTAIVQHGTPHERLQGVIEPGKERMGIDQLPISCTRDHMEFGARSFR